MVDDAFLADQPGSGPGREVMALDRGAELAEVRGAIQDLAPGHREVLGLTFGSGLSRPEVAGVLEIPVGTVKSRLTAARTALNRILNEKGKPMNPDAVPGCGTRLPRKSGAGWYFGGRIRPTLFRVAPMFRAAAPWAFRRHGCRGM